MDTTRWKQIDELFDAVLDLPEAEREAFLSEKCRDDEDLKKEVLSLLKAQTGSNNFLEKSAMGIVAQNLADEQTIIPENQLLGTKINTYKIESLLGSGGMGEVYLAHDEKLRRQVALKILPAEYTTNDERVKRFQLEARAVSALNHPNIVTIYDVGSFEGINFIATEYVEGKTVRELIGSGLKIKEILNIIIQSCEALSAAHERKIIHRDIKPENIIVRPDGYIKILDFGLAKLSEIDLNTLRNFSKTAKGVIIGTPAYMSPEQVADEKVDHRTDLWSIGVVLYELLTGINPFKKENRQATFQAILSQEPPPASSLNPEIPAELDQILVKALEKDADLSYQTASDLRADLKRAKREVDSSPSWSKNSSYFSPNKGAKAQYVFWLLPTIFLMFLVGFVVWYFYFRSPLNQPALADEWKNAKNVQLTASGGLYGYPSLSPDGEEFIYAYFDGKNRNIYLQRIGGLKSFNLTPGSNGNNTMPVFSPDGKLIAFRSEREPRGIYVMEKTSENPHRISDLGFHPSWSPDGTKIVVSDRAAAIHTAHSTPNSSLWIIDVKSGEKRKLDTKGDAIMPSWSPDGSRVAFWYVSQGTLGNIATIPVEGGDPVIVTDSPASDWNPVWSPDGKYLYFSSDRNGNMNLWRVAIDQKSGKTLGSPESVSTPTKYCRHITFSRDGKRLAYIRYESKSNLQTLAFDEKAGKVIGEPNWLTQGNREMSHPELSPDGETFVMRIPSRNQEDLLILNKDGTNERNLTNDKFNDRNPHWSPDGKRIAFQTDRSGKYQIWIINADSSDARQITFTEKIGVSNPVWSPDGSRMIYGELDEDRETPYLLDLTRTWNEQTPEKIPPPQNFTGSYSARDWSPDGQKLLVSFYEADGDEQGIGVYSFSTKTYEKITDEGSYPNWLSDNRRFMFNKEDKIFLADTITKKITELYAPSTYQIQQPNISPDYKQIYYRYLQIDADVWLLDATGRE